MASSELQILSRQLWLFGTCFLLGFSASCFMCVHFWSFAYGLEGKLQVEFLAHFSLVHFFPRVMGLRRSSNIWKLSNALTKWHMPLSSCTLMLTSQLCKVAASSRLWHSIWPLCPGLWNISRGKSQWSVSLHDLTILLPWLSVLQIPFLGVFYLDFAVIIGRGFSVMWATVTAESRSWGTFLLWFKLQVAETTYYDNVFLPYLDPLSYGTSNKEGVRTLFRKADLLSYIEEIKGRTEILLSWLRTHAVFGFGNCHFHMVTLETPAFPA